MAGWSGVKSVLDFEACLRFSGAGDNYKAMLYDRAKNERVAITREVFDQIRIMDSELAKEIWESEIEILDPDDGVFSAAEGMTVILSTKIRLNRVANDKIPVIASVQRAQNGSKPNCIIITGDEGTHSSSMRSLCDELGIQYLSVEDAFEI